MPHLVLYRAGNAVHPGGRPGGRPSVRDRLGLAVAGVLAVALLVAVMVVSFVIAIPLILVAIVTLARFAWKVRREVRRAGVAPDGNGAAWSDGARWPGEPWR